MQAQRFIVLGTYSYPAKGVGGHGRRIELHLKNISEKILITFRTSYKSYYNLHHHNVGRYVRS